jgi:large subunit ribosomal protein L24
MKIKKGDTVQVLSGNDKGKTGEVLETVPKNNKVIVKGINVRKKHVKPKKQGAEGGIISVECAVDSSKVGVVCSKCNKPTKIGYEIEKDGKVRICKKCKGKIK